jgi:hypothetical protein
LSAFPDRVSCGECGQLFTGVILDEEGRRAPCPNCRSTKLVIDASIIEKVRLGVKLGIKLKKYGIKKPVFESISGDDFHRNSQRWSTLSRTIDRQNDLYLEKIVDSETGEIIHYCSEPLSKHFGHGSAKLKVR